MGQPSSRVEITPKRFGQPKMVSMCLKNKMKEHNWFGVDLGGDINGVNMSKIYL